jgi:integrase
MQNLVLNQHNIFTFRKSVQGRSVRISLGTNEKSLAYRIGFRINEYLVSCPYLSADEIKTLIETIIADFSKRMVADKRLQLSERLKRSIEEEQQGLLLNEAIKVFTSEKIRTKSWSPHTQDLFGKIFVLFEAILGNCSVALINSNSAQTVKQYLQKLPANANKVKAYKTKTVHELVKLDIPDCSLLNIKTINMRLCCYSDFMSWCVKNGHCSNNPFNGMQLKDNREAKDLRLSFTNQDLKTIFTSPQITKPIKSYHKWLPYLGIYIGARINELCQLYLEDIVIIDSVPAISITDKRPDQKLKTSASRRIIPIHKDLVVMGFLEYVEQLRKVNQTRLFPELKYHNHMYSHEASKWFGRVKSKVLTDCTKKTFHSFRHTFVDRLIIQQGLAGNPIAKRLLGHTDKEITTGVYGSDFHVRQLNKIIQSLCILN